MINGQIQNLLKYFNFSYFHEYSYKHLDELSAEYVDQHVVKH